MKLPHDLTPEQRLQLLQHIWDVLWREPPFGSINPDKAWDADTLQDIAEAFDAMGLVPRSDQ